MKHSSWSGRLRPVLTVAAVAGAITFATTACRDDSPAAQRMQGPTGAADTVSEADLEQGGQIFAASCAVCHGANGEGDIGPNLTAMSDAAAVEAQVRHGGGGMPPFEGQLTEEEIEAVTLYVTDGLAGDTE